MSSTAQGANDGGGGAEHGVAGTQVLMSYIARRCERGQKEKPKRKCAEIEPNERDSRTILVRK